MSTIRAVGEVATGDTIIVPEAQYNSALSKYLSDLLLMYFPLTPLRTINTDVFHSSIVLLPSYTGRLLWHIVVMIGELPSTAIKERPTLSSTKRIGLNVAVTLQGSISLKVTAVKSDEGRGKETTFDLLFTVSQIIYANYWQFQV